MNFITRIPNYSHQESDPDHKTFFIKKDSKISIEKIIDNVLEKYEDLCNSYIILDTATWVLSFNVDRGQYNEMLESMVYIQLMEDNEKKCYVIRISGAAYQYEQWTTLIKKIEKELLKYCISQ